MLLCCSRLSNNGAPSNQGAPFLLANDSCGADGSGLPASTSKFASAESFLCHSANKCVPWGLAWDNGTGCATCRSSCLPKGTKGRRKRVRTFQAAKRYRCRSVSTPEKLLPVESAAARHREAKKQIFLSQSRKCRRGIN